VLVLVLSTTVAQTRNTAAKTSLC